MLEALGHTYRLQVIEMLMSWPDGSSAGDLAEGLGIPGSTLSFHLKRMVDAGILDQQRQHQQQIYRLIPGRLTEMAAFLTAHEAEGSE
jgi:DNA-binding transcriptional ArsR family regulator